MLLDIKLEKKFYSQIYFLSYLQLYQFALATNQLVRVDEEIECQVHQFAIHSI